MDIRSCAPVLALCAVMLAACGGGEIDQALVEQAEAAAPFYAAIDASNAATHLTNRYMSGHRPPDDSQLAEILVHVQAAIQEAERVDDDVLTSMHPDMRGQFEGKFRASLAHIAAGIERRDPDMMAEGHWLLEGWADWIEANGGDITFPPRMHQGE